jgi:5-methylcytosine-specific restriction endonuclease McrA
VLEQLDEKREGNVLAHIHQVGQPSRPDVEWLVSHALGLQRNYLRVKALSRPRSMQQQVATPKWSERSAIERVYRAAARLSEMLGIDYEVDHIVPIRSEIVSGLHVHANLQLLAAPENNQKSNRHWPDMP